MKEDEPTGQPKQPLSEAEVREKLQTQYGMTIIDPSDENMEIMQLIDREGLKKFLIEIGVREESVDSTIDGFINFLQLPIILDPRFTEENYRGRRWEIDKCGESCRKFFRSNKLRGRFLLVVTTYLKFIRDGADQGEESKIKKQVVTIIKGLPTPSSIKKEAKFYRDLDMDEKQQYVQTLDEVLRKFLRLFIKK